ncbi:hypothetical protein [Nonlabens xiamenensis]|uniref:hypothetical protein n=1 Tax=Nonlabens xiamenensis TaxID=2341043 RepID=UPI000F60E910|nr:hypothetical protein [Nonlabens xiamenensis]
MSEIIKNIFTEGVILSALGGLAYPLLTLLERIKQPSAVRIDFKDLTFYITVLIYVFMGSVIGYIYFNDKTGFGVNDRLLAFHVGITAPLIIRSLTTSLPKIKENL